MLRQLLVIAAASGALAAPAVAGPYHGPAHPMLPADAAPIRTARAQCAADLQDVISWSRDQTEAAITHLCALRAEHATARAELLARLAKLVAEYRDVTNHDHAANLAATVAGVQRQVAGCLATLQSQEFPHNVEVLFVPERDAIFCEHQAAALLGRIDAPYDDKGL